MKPILSAVAVAALLAVVAAEAYRWLWDGHHLGLLAVVFLACLGSGLAAMRLGRAAPRAAPRAVSRAPRERRTRRTEGSARRTEAPARLTEGRETGTVKWFSRSKGFGFVIREDGDEIFVHHRSVRADDGHRGNLRDGQRVTFVAVERSKGWQAEDVASADD